MVPWEKFCPHLCEKVNISFSRSLLYIYWWWKWEEKISKCCGKKQHVFSTRYLVWVFWFDAGQLNGARISTVCDLHFAGLHRLSPLIYPSNWNFRIHPRKNLYKNVLMRYTYLGIINMYSQWVGRRRIFHFLVFWGEKATIFQTSFQYQFFQFWIFPPIFYGWPAVSHPLWPSYFWRWIFFHIT